MSTWYRIHSWKNHIEPIEVVTITPKTVQVMISLWDGKKKVERHLRKNEYFQTFAEAKQELVRRLEREIEFGEKRLAVSQKQLALVKEMVNPVERSQS